MSPEGFGCSPSWQTSGVCLPPLRRHPGLLSAGVPSPFCPRDESENLDLGLDGGRLACYTSDMTTTTDPDHILVAASDLRPEDKVDLELDPYADDHPDGPSIAYQFVYGIVYQVDPSDAPPWGKAGPDQVAIEFEDGDYILFPKDHLLSVALDSPSRV